MADRSVGELVRAASAGDQAAWDRLVDRHSGLVWTVIRSHRLMPEDAADVFQSTWLHLVESLLALRDPDQLAGWLVTTTRRECLRIIKLRRREQPDPDVTDGADHVGELAPGPEAALLLDEERAVVARAFAVLTPRCQSLLRLVATDPTPSYEQIAELLDMPVGSIGPTRARCLTRLRRLLTDLDHQRQP